METIHLNAEGTQNYFDRYGETITNVSKTFGEIPKEWVQTDQAGKDEVRKQRKIGTVDNALPYH